MTPDQAIDYLKRNRHLLNLSGIAKEAGIAPSTLLNHLSGHVDADGYTRTIPSVKLLALAEVVSKLKDMETPINPQEELTALEKQLSALYLSISDKYKKMSKVSDNYRLEIMQSGIDSEVAQTKAVRQRMDALRKRIADEWTGKEKEAKF